MFKNALTAAGVSLALIATPSFAAPSDTPSADVKIADLNLGTAEGQKTLEGRIEAAARNVCGVGRHQTGSRMKSREVKRCVANAKEQVSKQVATIVDNQRLGG